MRIIEKNANGQSAKQQILVIEDDEFLSDAYLVKLMEAGIDVSVATNGEDGILQAKQKHPQLIILDLMLPKKDGFQVLAELKKDINTANIPVVVASNFSQPEEIDKAKKLGAKDYFVKSDISIRELIDTCKQYLPQ